MTTTKRAVDLLTESFDISERKKFEVKNERGEVVLDLYFKAITRSDRKKASKIATSEDPLEISTQMLCQMAELEDGTKAFQSGDAVKLQRELPENVLNEIELFLFGLDPEGILKQAKKD
tara:strand:- start:175 stop:531 length:357 start_codon:yes stop_codon:yes gene_type:complete